MASRAEEIVRDIFERWNSGERGFDPARFSDSVEVHSALTSTSYSGPDGLRQWVAEIDEQFAEWSVDGERFEEVRPNSVMVEGSIAVQGMSSGAAFVQPASWLVELEPGGTDGLRIAVFRAFLGRQTASEFVAA